VNAIVIVKCCSWQNCCDTHRHRPLMCGCMHELYWTKVIDGKFAQCGM